MSMSQARHFVTTATGALARAVASTIALQGTSVDFYIERPGSEPPFPRTAVIRELNRYRDQVTRQL